MTKIIDERLRQLSDPTIYTTVTSWEINQMAAELLAARQKIRADEDHLPNIEVLTRDLYETEQELQAAQKQIELLLDNLRDRDLINEKIRADAETRIVDLSSLPKR